MRRTAGGSESNSGNGDFERKDRRICWKSVGDESKADGSVAAAAVDGALRFAAAAGGEGKDGKQKNGKKRKSFFAIHVAPHDRVVCVAFAVHAKENRANSPQQNVPPWKTGRNLKKGRGAQLLNAVNQKRYKVGSPAGGLLR